MHVPVCIHVLCTKQDMLDLMYVVKHVIACEHVIQICVHTRVYAKDCSMDVMCVVVHV